MASLNATKRSRFERRLQDIWEREQSRKRIIQPGPEQSVESVTTELNAPIDELPEDDQRKISFESIKKAMDQVAGIPEEARAKSGVVRAVERWEAYRKAEMEKAMKQAMGAVDLPMPRLSFTAPKQIAEVKNLEGGETTYWLSDQGIASLKSDKIEMISVNLDPDPTVETKVYIDNQDVATVKRESMFGGKAIEFAEDQAVKPRLNKFLLDNFGKTFTFDATVEQPTFQFKFTEYPVTKPMTATQARIAQDTAWARQQAQLDAINEKTQSLVAEVLLGGPYCKASCGVRTSNQSGYCNTCLDRMAILGRTPEPTVKTPLVELRPKRRIQLED